jgi:hypothetical protein
MRRPIQTLVLAAIAFCATAVAASASGVLTVNLHDSRRIMLHGYAANVVVGDATIADVSMVDAHSVVLTGKQYGSTHVIITDHEGHTLLDAPVAVTAAQGGQVSVYRGGQSGPPTITAFACGGGRCHMESTQEGDASDGDQSTGGGRSGGLLGSGGILGSGATTITSTVTMK